MTAGRGGVDGWGRRPEAQLGPGEFGKRHSFISLSGRRCSKGDVIRGFLSLAPCVTLSGDLTVCLGALVCFREQARI